MARSVATICGLFMLGACVAHAQGPYVRPQTGPVARPALSPYLNLLHGGNPAINYYGLVRPQQEFGSAIQEIQNEMSAPHPMLTGANGATNLPITGHPSRFFSYQGHFFTHLGSGNGGTRTSGTPTPGAVSARPGQPVNGSRPGN
jgi:hypothetical protein